MEFFFLEYAQVMRIIVLGRKSLSNTSRSMAALVFCKCYILKQTTFKGDHPTYRRANVSSPRAPASIHRSASALTSCSTSFTDEDASLKHLAFRSFHMVQQTSANRESMPRRRTPLYAARSRRHHRSVVAAAGCGSGRCKAWRMWNQTSLVKGHSATI